MSTEYAQGEFVIWLREERRGWGGTRRIGAHVVKQTAKRVTLDVPMKDGSTMRVNVKPEKVLKRDN